MLGSAWRWRAMWLSNSVRGGAWRDRGRGALHPLEPPQFKLQYFALLPRIGIGMDRARGDARELLTLLVRVHFEPRIAIGEQLRINLPIAGEAHHQLRDAKRQLI